MTRYDAYRPYNIWTEITKTDNNFWCFWMVYAHVWNHWARKVGKI